MPIANADPRIRVYVLDGRAPEVSARISGLGGVAVVGAETDVLRGVVEMGERAVDVVLIGTDVAGAAMGGVLDEVRLRAPKAAVVVLHARGEQPVIAEALASGAAGAVPRWTETPELLAAIRVRHQRNAGRIRAAAAAPAAADAGPVPDDAHPATEASDLAEESPLPIRLFAVAARPSPEVGQLSVSPEQIGLDCSVVPAPPVPSAVASLETQYDRFADGPAGHDAGGRPKRVHPTAAASPAGCIIAVYSGKGGVGKTTVAVNLALAIQRAKPDARVCLMDLDLQFGDVEVHCEVRAQRITSIYDLVRSGEPASIDEDLFAGVLQPGPLGIRMLLAPRAPQHADLVEQRFLDPILTEAALSHDFVVADCGRHLGDTALAVIERADQVVLVTGASLASAKSVQYARRVVLDIGGAAERCLLVINQHEPCSARSVQDVSAIVGMPVAAVLPYDSAVAVSAEEARPMVANRPAARWSRAVLELARQIAGAGEPSFAQPAPSRINRLMTWARSVQPTGAGAQLRSHNNPYGG